MRTDGFHCRRESAGTEPVVLKVVSVTGVAFTGHHGPTNVRLSFVQYYKISNRCRERTASKAEMCTKRTHPRTHTHTGSEVREGTNGAGGVIRVGVGNGDGNGVGGGNGDVNGDGDGAGTGTGVETRGRTQDGNGDGSGHGNESSSGDRNGDEGGNGDGNEDGIGEDGGEAKKGKKPHKSCRRNPALSFRTHHHLCRQRVALAGTRQVRSQGPVSVHAHRTERVNGSEGREGANGVGGGIIVEGGSGDANGVGSGNVEVNENRGEGEQRNVR